MGKNSSGLIETETHISAEQLQTLAAEWSAATTRLAAAECAVALDKQQRQQDGMIARAIDALSDTPAEAECRLAQEALAKIQEAAVDDLHVWLDQRTATLLESDVAAPPWSKQLALRHLQLTNLLQHLREWHHLAANAVTVMEADAQKCRPVGTGELFHSIASWPLPPLVSLGVSELAAESVNNALQAVARLRAALPEQELSIDLEGLNDTFRRLIEYLHQPVFQFLSHAHAASLSLGVRPTTDLINKHDEVAEKLEMMARMLTPLTVHLGQLVDRAEKEIEKGAEQAVPVLEQYRKAACAELPDALVTLMLDTLRPLPQ